MELYLKENNMETLPTNLSRHLPSLTNIYLCKNFLTSIPNDVGNLTLLTVLDVSKEKKPFMLKSKKDLIFGSLVMFPL